MLNDTDAQLIKATRDEIAQDLGDTVTLTVNTVVSTDPYTKEPITTTDTQQVQAIVVAVSGQTTFINGVEAIEGDVMMTFDSSVDLSNVAKVTHDGVDYKLYSVEPKGLGAINRLVCVARRVY